MIGIGVMINQLSSNKKDLEILSAIYETKFETVELLDDVLTFTFENDYKVYVKDNGQCCCESRYMTTDDDLAYYKNVKLIDMELRNGETKNDNYGDPHEIQFLLVNTDLGTFTIETHNKHNGYYGGFAIRVSDNKNV